MIRAFQFALCLLLTGCSKPSGPASSDPTALVTEVVVGGVYAMPSHVLTDPYWSIWKVVWSGRPTPQDWRDDLERHQQALIALGYYERQWVPWRDDPKWVASFTNTVIWKSGCMSGDSTHPAEICLTARPIDIQEFEQIIRVQFDTR